MLYKWLYQLTDLSYVTHVEGFESCWTLWRHFLSLDWFLALQWHTLCDVEDWRWKIYSQSHSYSKATICFCPFFPPSLWPPASGSPEAAIKSLEWEGLSAHSPKCDSQLGRGGIHRPSKIYSGLSSRVFSWHDAPKRSPVCEITFIQPSHAWMDYFGCSKKAATKQWLLRRVCRVRK